MLEINKSKFVLRFWLDVFDTRICRRRPNIFHLVSVCKRVSLFSFCIAITVPSFLPSWLASTPFHFPSGFRARRYYYIRSDTALFLAFEKGGKGQFHKHISLPPPAKKARNHRIFHSFSMSKSQNSFNFQGND